MDARYIFDQSVLNKEWHMTYAEMVAMLYLLDRIRPQVAVEVGTFLGGSLDPISKFSKEAYSLDIAHRISNDGFDNVRFVPGDSRQTLPLVLAEIAGNDKDLEFVLIDGDHSTEGVKADIQNLFGYRPVRKPLYIVMHDSFNPDVRAGILQAGWEHNPYVHGVEIDFIQGTFYDRPEIYRQMWGGLALAVMQPSPRTAPLQILQTHRFLFESTLQNSSHR